MDDLVVVSVIEAPLIPPSRLAALLGSRRRELGVDLVTLAQRSNGAFNPTYLEGVERGRFPLDETALRAIIALYELDAGPIVPQRSKLVLDLDQRQLAVGSTALSFESPTADAVLERYVSLLYLLRSEKPGRKLTLRDDDLDVLGSTFDRDQQRLRDELFAIMGEQATEERTSRLGAKTVILGAGLLVGATAVGSLVIVGSPGSAEQVLQPGTPRGALMVESGGGAVEATLASAHTSLTAEPEGRPAIKVQRAVVTTAAVTAEDSATQATEATEGTEVAPEDEVVAAVTATASQTGSGEAINGDVSVADSATQGEIPEIIIPSADGSGDIIVAPSTTASEETTRDQEVALAGSADEGGQVDEEVALAGSADEGGQVDEGAALAGSADEGGQVDEEAALAGSADEAGQVEVVEAVAVAASPAEVGRQAMQSVSYDIEAALPGWTIDFEGDSPHYHGLTNSKKKTIVVYVEPGMGSDYVAEVLMHEVGHALDLERMTDADRREWIELRNMPSVWWAGSGLSDFAVGAGDFAEGVAAVTTGSPSDSVYGEFTAAQKAFVLRVIS